MDVTPPFPTEPSAAAGLAAFKAMGELLERGPLDPFDMYEILRAAYAVEARNATGENPPRDAIRCLADYAEKNYASVPSKVGCAMLTVQNWLAHCPPADLTEPPLDANGREWAAVARELADALKDACEYIQHTSWRCGHPDRFPYDPDCSCGLVAADKRYVAALARFDSLSGETPE